MKYSQGMRLNDSHNYLDQRAIPLLSNLYTISGTCHLLNSSKSSIQTFNISRSRFSPMVLTLSPYFSKGCSKGQRKTDENDFVIAKCNIDKR